MTEHKVDVVTTDYGSATYKAALKLRYNHLRAPLGLQFTDAEMTLDALGTHFVALAGTEIIGCVTAQLQDGYVKIRQMVVADTMRAKGVGRLLIHALEEHFVSRGISHFMMHARADAIGFYEKLGYSQNGDSFTEIGMAHQRLDKVFTPSI